jgi:RNA polymerase sigma-70 factor (ECF subfamily)
VITDEVAFGERTAPHRRELHVHCYRMLGSFHEAEDLVQEVYLRAWRARATFGTSGRDGDNVRAWLYRIATNACLDHLARGAQGEVPHAVEDGPRLSIAAVPWLEPYPDHLLDAAGPEGRAIARESVELAYLAALQVLAPRQRAAVLLRDVLGWTAPEAAAALGLTEGAVTSALQRGRAALRRHGPDPDARPPAPGGDEERALVARFVTALEAYDVAALLALVRADARMTAPPDPRTWDGRAAIAAEAEHGWGAGAPGPARAVVTRANGHPAVAAYVHGPGDAVPRPFVLSVLRFDRGALAELTSFGPGAFAAFGLPAGPA